MAELLSYVKPRHLLCVENDYKFFNLATGFHLSRKDFVLDMDMGLWSSVFLSHYIQSSGARGVGAFEVGFDQNAPLLKQGMLCSVSKQLEMEMEGAHPFDRDCAAIRQFRSGETVRRISCTLKELQTAYPFGLVSKAAVTITEAKQFLGFGAFQRAFKLPEGGLPPAWADMIRERGYSWNWFDGSLVVANTRSAELGIPPNYEHLGLEKLELNFRPIKVCGAAGPPSVKPKPAERKEQGYAGDAWRKLIGAFRAEPSIRTLTAITTDLTAHAEFLSMKDRPEYNPGSRSKKWTTVLVDRFLGPSKAATFPELARALDEITGDDGILCQFILIKKLVGQAKILVEQETIHYIK